MTVPASVPEGDLLTLRELAVWAREEIEPDNEFAIFTISAASLVVRNAAGHPEWTYDTAPALARTIAAQLAKRSYLNPDAVTRSNIGPLGESTVEDYARTLELTAVERADLEEIGGRTKVADAGGSMWIQPLSGTAETPTPDTLYVLDSRQSWLAFYEPGDVGLP